MVLFCYPSTCKTADFLLALTLFAIIAIETCQGRWTHAPLLLFVWIKIHPPCDPVLNKQKEINGWMD